MFPYDGELSKMLKNTKANLKQKGFVFICFSLKSTFLEVKKKEQTSTSMYNRTMVIIQMYTLHVTDAL